ncbi:MULTISPECIES: GntR family transcriptional regulator [Rhodobacterales]|uniref:GntR family transcriptional regulator n=1 Tax=Roseobacter sp. N2S TaxID=2663844 RepID=UPI0028553824|nr:MULTISPECIES: GntR family transcriptional regulator [Rhodobacterales]MDR6264494.1 DNA-binding GntR family transcriptional regulator [Roseobacter sp. N2S]
MESKSFFEPRENETIGDVAYRRIKSDIIRGYLKPGEKLKIDALKERYAVGVSTVREILTRLWVEQLIHAEGQRGFEVAGVSQAGLRDVAALRLLLETQALRQSIAAGDLRWEADVVRAHYMLSTVEEKIIEGDLSMVNAWVQQDWEFHHATISACASPAIMAAHSSAFDRFIRYHMLVLEFRGRPAAVDHSELRDLVVARKADAAVKLLTNHIQSGLDLVLSTGRIPL